MHACLLAGLRGSGHSSPHDPGVNCKSRQEDTTQLPLRSLYSTPLHRAKGGLEEALLQAVCNSKGMETTRMPITLGTG